MTGYGKAEALLDTGKLTIEIRALNGKNADVTLKTSLLPKDKELLVRQILADALHRGTIDLFLNWEPNAADSAKKINTDLVQEYYRQIWDIRQQLQADKLLWGIKVEDDALLSAILRFPDIMDQGRQEVIPEENWPKVEDAVKQAIAALDTYRSTEGAALYRDVTSRINHILELETQVEAFESERVATVRERLQKNLDDLQQKVDPARFEQEMIFYLEKLDINEEKVRLRHHCRYFLDTIDGEQYPGRKLGFIIQEMGREINTTGSKANHAGIQKLVVQMKDELEKIREQSLNIL